MKSQNIFERYEMKYIVTDAQRDAILRETAAHLKGDQYGQSTICNLYYDVPSYTLIRRSLEKPAYKEKLRVRSYGVARPDSKVFVELKKKAYGIVYKRRVSLPEREAMFYLGSDAMGGLPGQDPQGHGGTGRRRRRYPPGLRENREGPEAPWI